MAISELRPAEKGCLFKLLADRRQLPARYLSLAPQGEQMGLIPSSAQHSRSPDIILTFGGGSRGNPGWGYGSYLVHFSQ